MDQYQNTLSYLYNLKKFNPQYSTEPTSKLLALLRHPEKKFSTIIVGGTNGKGSVCSMLENLLRQAGYKTGLFTSPHLEKFNERIRIGLPKKSTLQQIQNDEIINLVQKIKPLVQKLKSLGSELSFHEALVALALLYFQEKKIDLALLEVGMGGRLDAVNAVQPVLSIITNIQYDHTEILGKKLENIAREKIGIARPGSCLITAAQGSGLKEIQKISRQRKIKLKIVRQKNIKITYFPSFSKELLTQKFSYKNYKNLSLSLLGPHQSKNAALVIEAFEELRRQKFKISKQNLKQALKTTSWAGRFEIIWREDSIILDCAHNPAGIKALGKTLKLFHLRNLICIFGASYSLITQKPNFKKIKEMLRLLNPFIKKIIFTRAEYRGINPNLLEKIYCQDSTSLIHSKQALKILQPKKAFQKAQLLAKNKETILICGSIYLIGEIRKELF